jgi:arylformamidase
VPRTVIDLSHPIHDGMDAYPGLPSPAVGLHIDHEGSRAQYDEQAEFAIGRFELVGNVGTYLDSPFHRYPDGPDVSDLPLAGLVDLPTVVVDARQHAQQGRCLDVVLADIGSLAGRAVLFHTGWDRRWGSPAYWEPGPYLGEVTIEQLLHHRPALVGVDFWNVDDPDDPRRPAHTRLLGDGIPIVEHLTRLGEIPADARTFVVPLPIEGAPSVPVRAFAIANPA